MPKKRKDSLETVAKRKRVWRHNGFLGTVSMAQKGMWNIMTSDTATPQAKELANELRNDLLALYELLKERVDAN